MSFEMFAVVVAVSWLSAGLTVSLFMGRRGHSAFTWLVLGTIFGPLGAIFAAQARQQKKLPPEVVAPAGASGEGPVDVLVGVDGSPESRAALAAATALLGPRMGRLTLATVVLHDSGVDAERAARAMLAEQGAAAPGGPQLEVLHGRPAQVLLERVAEGGYDVLVIGARGSGASKALLGSTAVEAAEAAKVPVLLMGADRAS